MGEVYKARDTRLDRTVVVKILHQPKRSAPCSIHTSATTARTIDFDAYSRV